MIKVKTDFSGAFKLLQKLEKQSRYAAAVALTRTAQAVAKREAEEVARAFDRPVPFTSKAFVVKRATPSNLRAEVIIRDRQADYLKPHIDGGDRKPKRHEMLFTADARAPRSYWVPAQSVELNAHGNVSRAQIKKLAVQLRQSGKHGAVFAGTPQAWHAIRDLRQEDEVGQKGAHSPVAADEAGTPIQEAVQVLRGRLQHGCERAASAVSQGME